MNDYDYSQEGAYFITTCVNNRHCLFGEIHHGKMFVNEYGDIISQAWEWLQDQYPFVFLGERIIMPNHFHGIIFIREATCRGGSRTALAIKPLGRIIGAFKTISTKHVNQIRNETGAPLWQRNYYEHVIRNDKDYYRVAEYITNNPENWETDEMFT